MDEDKDVIEGSESSQDSSTENTSESGTVTQDVKKSDAPMIPKKRFDEINAANKELKAKLEALKPQPKQEVGESNPQIEARLIAVEFMAKHREFDAMDYETAHIIAKGKGVSLEDAIKDPLFVNTYDKRASEKAVANATPTSGRSPKVTPPKPVKEMSREEHEEYFKKVLGS